MDIDRASASANQLYLMVVREDIHLDPAERARLTPDYLFVLAITNKLELEARDRARLQPMHLAQLAITGKICLSQEDKDRLPVNLLIELIADGVTEVGDVELARLQPRQLAYLRKLEAGTDGAETALLEKAVPQEICS
jgi:hypothetical protein